MKRYLFALILTVILLSISSNTLAYGEDIDEEASTKTVVLEYWEQRIHAFSRTTNFKIVSARDGRTIAYANQRVNVGFTGWVVDISTTDPVYITTLAGKVITDVEVFNPKSTIGWSWVSNNQLLVSDFPLTVEEAEKWLLGDKYMTFACIPSGKADAKAIANSLVNETPSGKYKALGLHKYLRSAYPYDVNCNN